MSFCSTNLPLEAYLPEECAKPGNPLLKGKIQYDWPSCTNWFRSTAWKEVNCTETELSPSVRVPWLNFNNILICSNLTYFLSICKFGDEQKVENHIDILRQHLTFLAQIFAIFSQNKFESERHQHTKQKFSILQILKKLATCTCLLQ
jgi:hypothetical protein